MDILLMIVAVSLLFWIIFMYKSDNKFIPTHTVKLLMGTSKNQDFRHIYLCIVKCY